MIYGNVSVSFSCALKVGVNFATKNLNFSVVFLFCATNGRFVRNLQMSTDESLVGSLNCFHVYQKVMRVILGAKLNLRGNELLKEIREKWKQCDVMQS